MKPYSLSLVFIAALIFSLSSSNAMQIGGQSQKAETAAVLYEKARHLAEQTKYREAIESYTAAIDLEPDDPRAYVGRGDAKFGLEDLRGAIRDYDKAIDIYFSWKPDEPEKKVGDSTGNVTLQEFEAMQARPKASDAAAALGPTYFRRGLAKKGLGDTLGACQDFREYCKWDGEDFSSFKICNGSAESPPRDKSELQTRSVSSKLEGTRWRAIHDGEIYSPLLERMVSKQFFCSFGNQGKVSCTVFGTASSKMTYEQTYDPIRRRSEPKPVRLPPSTLSEEIRVGTYKQNGNSVQIDLPAYEIDATVRGNSMTGNITFKLEFSQKTRWVAERITGETPK